MFCDYSFFKEGFCWGSFLLESVLALHLDQGIQQMLFNQMHSYNSDTSLLSSAFNHGSNNPATMFVIVISTKSKIYMMLHNASCITSHIDFGQFILPITLLWLAQLRSWPTVETNIIRGTVSIWPSVELVFCGDHNNLWDGEYLPRTIM